MNLLLVSHSFTSRLLLSLGLRGSASVVLQLCSSRTRYRAAARLRVSLTADADADWLLAARGAAGSSSSPLLLLPVLRLLQRERGESVRSRVTRLKLCSGGYRRHPGAQRKESRGSHFASFSLFTRGNTITRSGDEEETSLWHLTGRPSIPNSMRCSYGRQG